MERKRYIKEIYTKWWQTARKKLYGFMEYDKNLCHYICQHIPQGSRLLEVAIGNGYPVADFLQKAGYEIHGIDFSPYLINECRKLNPNIKCKVGDAEFLEYVDNIFDATYCFHSTWYFPDLNKVIDEMVRVTRPAGIIMFDIQNRNNKQVEEAHKKNILRGKGIRRIITFTRNLASVILRRSAFNWHFLFHYVVHEVPTYPESVYRHLKDIKITGFQVMAKENDESLRTANESGPFKEYSRLVIVIKK